MVHRQTYIVLVPSLVILSVIVAFRYNHQTNPSSANSSFDAFQAEVVKNSKHDRIPSIKYSCPVHGNNTAVKSLNELQDPEYFEDYLDEIELKSNSTDDGNDDEKKFDAWGLKPGEKLELDAGTIDWFASSLKPHDTLYESACGAGRTLMNHLKLLKEKHEIYPIEVYGNDYLEESSFLANRLFRPKSETEDGVTTSAHVGELYSDIQFIKGRFCQGDSTNLYYVPSSSFDMVYTGYIDPLVDPLLLEERTGDWKTKRKFCKAEDNSLEKMISDIDQRAQEDWYALWVREMLRIVKPGGAVVIEMVSHPFCLHWNDWGGVRKRFWRGGVKRYGWDVDPLSIEIRDAQNTVFWTEDRYGVFMRRKS